MILLNLLWQVPLFIIFLCTIWIPALMIPGEQDHPLMVFAVCLAVGAWVYAIYFFGSGIIRTLAAFSGF